MWIRVWLNKWKEVIKSAVSRSGGGKGGNFNSWYTLEWRSDPTVNVWLYMTHPAKIYRKKQNFKRMCVCVLMTGDGFYLWRFFTISLSFFGLIRINKQVIFFCFPLCYHFFCVCIRWFNQTRNLGANQWLWLGVDGWAIQRIKRGRLHRIHLNVTWGMIMIKKERVTFLFIIA